MRDRFRNAETFREFLSNAQGHQDLWRQIYARACIPEDLEGRIEAISGHWHFLVLAEDWCGDAIHVLPYLARLEEASSKVDLRVVSREGNPDLIDSHLTNGTRSIPVLLILDEEFREVAWWGPRPEPLQDLFLREIKLLPEEERFRPIRAWFARDQGRTTLMEVLSRIPAVV